MSTAPTKELPGPKGLERLRYVRRLREPGIIDAVLAIWKTYGDTAAIALPFGHTVYFLNDPADVMEILHKQGKKFIKGNTLNTFKMLIGYGVATSEKEDWITHRRGVQPSFHRAALESYVPTIFRVIEEHRKRWLKAGDEFLDFNSLFPELSQDIVARAVLGAELGPRLEEVHRAWDAAMNFILARTHAIVRWPVEWPLPSHRRFRRSARLVRDTVDEIVASHAARSDIAANTFMGRLLAASVRGEVTHSGLREQILNLLFAGFETTANGLSSAIYLVLSHPEVEEKIKAEIDAVLGGDPPCHAALEKQTYLRQVIYETLRLHPPVCLIPRQALEEVTLPTVVLPKGATVLLSPFVLHRHPKLWSEPERFDPERFASPSEREPPKFIAFGAGARTCVGDQFAVNEMMLVLSDMFQKLDLEMDRSRPIGLFFNGTLRPDPFRVRVRPR